MIPVAGGILLALLVLRAMQCLPHILVFLFICWLIGHYS
jgi:hypothetical protein